MKPSFPQVSEPTRRISAKLTVDALGLFVLFGAGYLLAEFILPGIFSARMNYFLFFVILTTLILLAALAFRRLDGETSGSTSGTTLSKPARIGLALLATAFLFWGEKKVPLTILAPLAIVTLAVLLSFFGDIFGKPASDTE